MLTFPDETERKGRMRSGREASVWPAGREREMAALTQPLSFKLKVTDRQWLSFIGNTRADPSTHECLWQKTLKPLGIWKNPQINPTSVWGFGDRRVWKSKCGHLLHCYEYWAVLKEIQKPMGFLWSCVRWKGVATWSDSVFGKMLQRVYLFISIGTRGCRVTD